MILLFSYWYCNGLVPAMISFFLFKCVAETLTMKPRFCICCWSFCKHRHKSPAGLSLQRQFPACCCIYPRTFLYQHMQHTHTHRHARTRHTQISMYNIPPASARINTQSLLKLSLLSMPPPLFSFSSLSVCITGSHRRFLVLNRDILAPDSRSLTRCSSRLWILYWG